VDASFLAREINWRLFAPGSDENDSRLKRLLKSELSVGRGTYKLTDAFVKEAPIVSVEDFLEDIHQEPMDFGTWRLTEPLATAMKELLERDYRDENPAEFDDIPHGELLAWGDITSEKTTAFEISNKVFWISAIVDAVAIPTLAYNASATDADESRVKQVVTGVSAGAVTFATIGLIMAGPTRWDTKDLRIFTVPIIDSTNRTTYRTLRYILDMDQIAPLKHKLRGDDLAGQASKAIMSVNQAERALRD